MIQVEGLSKIYRVAEKQPGLAGTLRHFVRRRTRDVMAVQDVSFRIEPGEMVGFLGANGAGKTTTLKMLCGLIHPSAGGVQVAGYRPQRRQAEFLRRITLVLPVAFLTTVPAQVLLGEAAAPMLLTGVVLAVMFFAVARAFWLFALRFYTSASS